MTDDVAIPANFSNNIGEAVSAMEKMEPKQIASVFRHLGHSSGSSIGSTSFVEAKESAIRDAGILIAERKISEAMIQAVDQLNAATGFLAKVGIGVGVIAALAGLVQALAALGYLHR